MATDQTPPLAFAADRMLMRLARWLRLLGLDVVTDPALTGAELLKVARTEHRILLTRDKRLRTASDVMFLEANALRDQLREVVTHFGICINTSAGAFTRCSRCNRVLSPVARDLVARRVPPFVFASHDRFAECEGCGRIYWSETHPQRIMAMLSSIGVEVPPNTGF